MWARAYAARQPGISVRVEGTATAAAFDALRERKAALALVSRVMRYQEAEACQTAWGRRPEEFKVAVDAAAVYVNARNPIRALTYDELAGIFRRSYRDWGQLAGPDAPISFYCPGGAPAISELFREEILNGKDCAPGFRAVAGAELLKAIANDQNGIGYGALGSLQGARALGIKRAFSSTPVEPTNETIANRIYPLSRYLYVYLDPAANQGALGAYVDWMRSDEGQEIVKAGGFFPLPAKLRAAK
jgi:phosphate transport system substrate-binding protein